MIVMVRILLRELYNSLRIEQNALMITSHEIKMIVVRSMLGTGLKYSQYTLM
jgi:hypothetical protein